MSLPLGRALARPVPSPRGRLDILDSDLRQAMYESADEPATQDVYVEVVRGIEKQRWMLQAHLARQPSM